MLFWISGFRALPIEDRIALVQNAVYQIVLTMLSLDYDEVTGYYNYFNFTKDEERCILNLFPEYDILPKQFIYFGQTFKKMQMDEMEIAHFCALILLCLGESYSKLPYCWIAARYSHPVSVFFFGLTGKILEIMRWNLYFFIPLSSHQIWEL